MVSAQQITLSLPGGSLSLHYCHILLWGDLTFRRAATNYLELKAKNDNEIRPAGHINRPHKIHRPDAF
jgi:hypothetical protein